ncbi:hypothetical protein BpHYR1_015469, partial [Brachionus plicatilis]
TLACAESNKRNRRYRGFSNSFTLLTHNPFRLGYHRPFFLLKDYNFLNKFFAVRLCFLNRSVLNNLRNLSFLVILHTFCRFYKIELRTKTYLKILAIYLINII